MGLILSRYWAIVSDKGGNGSFGSSSYSVGSSSLALLSFDQAFLGVGGVGLSLLLGDLMLSLELILTNADLGVFGSDENIDLLPTKKYCN